MARDDGSETAQMLGWLTVGTIVLLAGAVVQLVTRVAICLAIAIASRGSKRQRPVRRESIRRG